MAFTRHVVADAGSLTYATVGAVANDLLFMFIFNDGGDDQSDPTNWTRLDSNDGSSVEGGAYYLIATGSETGDIITDEGSFGVNNEEYAIHLIKIPAAEWHGTTVPEIATQAGGGTGTIDPPNLAPSWGSETDNIWFVAGGRDDDQGISSATANYSTNFATTVSSTGSGTCEVASSWRTNTAASENPGSWTHTGTDEEVKSFTVGVRPPTPLLPVIDGSTTVVVSTAAEMNILPTISAVGDDSEPDTKQNVVITGFTFGATDTGSAKVEITDNAIYGAGSFEIEIPRDSWSATSIQVDLEETGTGNPLLDDLTAGTNYAYVTDSAGIRSLGFAFTLKEVGAGFLAAEGADATIAVDTPFRVRFKIKNTGDPELGPVFELWAQKNAESYFEVTDSSTKIQFELSTHYADGDDNVDQLLSGAETFITNNNAGKEQGGTGDISGGAPISNNEVIETEYCFTMPTADMAASDTITLEMRLNGGVQFDTYTDRPVITVAGAATIDIDGSTIVINLSAAHTLVSRTLRGSTVNINLSAAQTLISRTLLGSAVNIVSSSANTLVSRTLRGSTVNIVSASARTSIQKALHASTSNIALASADTLVNRKLIASAVNIAIANAQTLIARGVNAAAINLAIASADTLVNRGLLGSAVNIVITNSRLNLSRPIHGSAINIVSSAARTSIQKELLATSSNIALASADTLVNRKLIASAVNIAISNAHTLVSRKIAAAAANINSANARTLINRKMNAAAINIAIANSRIAINKGLTASTVNIAIANSDTKVSRKLLASAINTAIANAQTLVARDLDASATVVMSAIAETLIARDLSAAAINIIIAAAELDIPGGIQIDIDAATIVTISALAELASSRKIDAATINIVTSIAQTLVAKSLVGAGVNVASASLETKRDRKFTASSVNINTVLAELANLRGIDASAINIVSGDGEVGIIIDIGGSTVNIVGADAAIAVLKSLNAATINIASASSFLASLRGLSAEALNTSQGIAWIAMARDIAAASTNIAIADADLARTVNITVSLENVVISNVELELELPAPVPGAVHDFADAQLNLGILADNTLCILTLVDEILYRQQLEEAIV